MRNPSVVLWGIGNPLYGDDAAGPVLADNLKDKAPCWLEVYNCETVPENYLAPLRKLSPETLLIVDAADMGKDPGDIRRLAMKDFSNISFSTHGLPLNMMLENLSHEVIIIGIQPLSRELATGLSEPVLNAVEKLEAIISTKDWGSIDELYQENRSPR